MSNILTAFNTHLIDFITEIIAIFPEKKGLRVTKTALETWRRVNPRSIIYTWKVGITDKYDKEILRGNVDFFLEKDYVTDISGCEDSRYILSAIDRLRDPLRAMGKENQKKACKYVQNLTKLSKLYFDK
jgi:hypothetical protein